MSEPAWIPFPEPIKMIVEWPFDGVTCRNAYPMLAWRWNPELRACQYLEVSGFIWHGKNERQTGVVGVAEDGA